MAQPVKVIRARLKFDPSLPWFLELKMREKYGFQFLSRKQGAGGWIVYQKYDGMPKVPVDFGDLTDSVINELTRKCNHIAGAFMDPEAHRDTIKMRVTNYSRTLDAKQRAWVQDWIKRVLDEDDDDTDQLPWTD